MKMHEVLKDRFRELGWTYDALAAASGVAHASIYKYFNGQQQTVTSLKFVAICQALDIDIESFIARGGCPEISDDTDMRAVADEFLHRATPTELMEIRIQAAELMPWAEIWRTRDVRNKALEDESCSEGLTALAQDDLLWFRLRPTGAEIEKLESSGKHETDEDYMHALISLRRRERRAADECQAARKQPRKRRPPAAQILEVPHYGRIAAGHPIDVINDGGETVQINAAIVRDPKKAYALTVSGDSMIDEGMNDGDIIIVNASETAQPGQTVVALIDDEKATVKKYWPEGANIRLKPANPDHQPMIYAAERVRIQGTIAGLMRGF